MQKTTVKANGQNFVIYLRDEADSSVAAEIFKIKEYRFADEVIRSAGDAILDIGAHTGMFSIYARSLNPHVRIVAMEPEPHNLELFKKHLLENKISGVEVLGAALAGRAGEYHLQLSPDSHAHRLSEQQAKQGSLVVTTLTLADLLERYNLDKVALLKLDIEGAEYEVLLSTESETFAKIGAVAMEYHEQHGSRLTLEKVLRENGFGVQVFPSRFDKTMGFIFATNKRF